MSEEVYTIINPLKFMTESLLREKLVNYGFPEEVVSINIIKNDEEMCIEVELHFKIPEIGEKFFSKYNGKSFGFGQNYKLNIQKGLSSKKTIHSKTKEIIYSDKYECWIDTHYFRKKNEEGLILVNPCHKEYQKEMIKYLIQKIKSTFIKGHNIINYLFPIISYDRRTLLQVFAYELREAPYILNKTYYISNPIEKLKNMTSFVISQIYLSPLRIKPFNPLLGETLQIKIGNMNCYFEQTMINPPTTNIYCFDSDGLYKIYGHISIYTKTGVNNCKIIKLGNIFVEYKDGQKYKIYYPSYFIGGITVGKRSFNVNDSSLVIDETNRIVSFIKFKDRKNESINYNNNYNYNSNDYYSNNINKVEKYPDNFKGNLISINEVKIDEKGPKHCMIEEYSIAELSGEWTKELLFGDKIYWKRDKNQLLKMYEPEYKLMSDSSLREDLMLYNENKNEDAEKKMYELEQKQYNDCYLRDKYKK